MMIIRSRVVVPMVGRADREWRGRDPGNKITGVGRFEEVKASHGGDILDLGEQSLLPGLINAHCHLDYTLLRGQIPPQKSFTDWIRAINAAQGSADGERLRRFNRRRALPRRRNSEPRRSST